MLSNVFELLLNTPTTITEIPELYQFTAIFHDKDNGKLRPLAVQESILNVFHKLILEEIRTDLNENQLALERAAYEKCIIKAK